MTKQETEIKDKAAYRAVSLVGGTSLTFVLPRHFADRVLGIERGDYVRIIPDGKRLVIEKAE